MCYKGTTEFGWANPGGANPPQCTEGVIFIRSANIATLAGGANQHEHSLAYIWTVGGITYIHADAIFALGMPPGPTPWTLAAFWLNIADVEYRVFQGMQGTQGVAEPGGAGGVF